MAPKYFSHLIFALCFLREDPPTCSQADSDNEAEEAQVSRESLFSICSHLDNL